MITVEYVVLYGILDNLRQLKYSKRGLSSLSCDAQSCKASRYFSQHNLLYISSLAVVSVLYSVRSLGWVLTFSSQWRLTIKGWWQWMAVVIKLPKAKWMNELWVQWWGGEEWWNFCTSYWNVWQLSGCLWLPGSPDSCLVLVHQLCVHAPQGSHFLPQASNQLILFINYSLEDCWLS